MNRYFLIILLLTKKYVVNKLREKEFLRNLKAEHQSPFFLLRRRGLLKLNNIFLLLGSTRKYAPSSIFLVTNICCQSIIRPKHF